MLLDNEKLAMLEKTFMEKKDGLSMPEFVQLVMHSIYFRKEEEIDLVFGLVQLFKDIDINGDGNMEWEEFTQYLIETMVGDKGISGANGNYSSGTKGHTDCKLSTLILNL